MELSYFARELPCVRLKISKNTGIKAQILHSLLVSSYFSANAYMFAAFSLSYDR